jgi:beta-galactosidase
MSWSLLKLNIWIGMRIIVILELMDDTQSIITVEKVTLSPPHPTEGRVHVSCNMTMKNAKLWSIQHPSLYSIKTILFSKTNEKFLDAEQTFFGIRKLAWDPEMGFFLNDENIKILGVANHQDFAGVGVAVPDSLQSYRVSKIQQLGGNAWRTAHNAPNPVLLDTTDRMGMLVWDENHRNGEIEHAKLLVKRDRNHPSIIIWSICNEILCDCGDGADSELSLKHAYQIKRAFQELDPYGQRVVSANQNAWVNQNITLLDLLGFDYSTDAYDNWHRMIPNRPAISSETSSAIGDRGEYVNDKERGHISAYDTTTVPWGQTTQKAWGGFDEQNPTNHMGILTRTFVAGGFTWTGFDYRGEPTPYAWPDVSSHFGIYDIAGFDKDRVGWYKSWWPLENKKKKQQLQQTEMHHLHVFPHWNWATTQEEVLRNPHLTLLPTMDHPVIEVRVYSNAPAVELFRNGVLVGECRLMPKFGYLAWNVTFEPGNITARSYANISSCDNDNDNKNPKVILQEMTRITTGPPAKLRTSWSNKQDWVGLAKNSWDIQDEPVVLLRVDVVDSSDRIVPLPNEYPIPVTFTITSDYGRLLGTGNGDPSDLISDKSPTRNAYHGSVLGIIQATMDGSCGDDIDNCFVDIVVSSDGFENVTVEIPIPMDGYQQPLL